MSYWHSARSRAARRKSLWNLLLIPAALIPWFLGWWLSAAGFAQLYRWMHPRAVFIVVPDSIGGLLIALGLLFAWCPVAMTLGNVMVHAVTPARQALDREASSVRGTDFRSSNRALVEFAAVTVPSGLLLSVIGLLLPL